MPISCLPTETSYDVQCPVCGNGFMLLTAPNHGMQTGTLRNTARQALAGQHNRSVIVTGRIMHAHPDGVFELPGWDGSVGPAEIPAALLDPAVSGR